MKKLNFEKKLCIQCMEEHEVYTVLITDTVVFKGKEVSFNGIYEYCENSEELMETEEMIKKNKLTMIDIYREEVGLLTSYNILNIRDKYSVSQKDFSEILDWGRTTITRYENHQVQDRAHDDVLKMANSDPKWFLDKLEVAKDRLSDKAYKKYITISNKLYRNHTDLYLREAIEAIYASYDEPRFNGDSILKLNKVTDVINYLAQNIISLHKVKLMKLLWYADNLNFERVGHSITGLRYIALPMGAVAEAYDKIIGLNNVSYKDVYYEDYEYVAQKFEVINGFKVQFLNSNELEVLDTTIEKLGDMNKKKMVNL